MLRSDRGGEFNNGMMQDYLASQSVQVSLGAPYHPDHTRCEPHNHTIKRFMRSGLLESGLDHELWAYFAKQAVECRNMYSRKDGKSAVELMSGGRVVPKINHLRPIGCRAICKKTNVELIAEGSSLAPRGHEGINLGTERDSPGYLVWVPSLGKVKVSADVDFNVDSFPGADDPRKADYFDGDKAQAFVKGLDFSRAEFDPVRADEVFRSNGSEPVDGQGHEQETEQEPDPNSNQEPVRVGSDTDLQTESDGSDEDGAGDADPPARTQRDRRPAANRDDVQAWGGWSQRERALAATCADLLAQTGASDALDGHDLNGELDEGDFIILQFDENLQQGENYSALCDRLQSSSATSQHSSFFVALRTESAYATKVLSTAQALNGPRREEHLAAIDKELHGHLKVFGTYTLIPLTDMPLEANLIDLKLILAEKFGAMNEFLKAKARLVARGDQEEAGRDFDPWQTWSSMLRYSSLRLLCSMAALTGRKLSSSDAVQAYLNAGLKKPRHGRLPKELREYNADGVELIALIRQALYGLSESGHA